MAMPLEQRFMNYIGLGMYPNYYYGSSSCEHIRHTAVERLGKVLNLCEEGKIGQFDNSISYIGTREDFEREAAKAAETRQAYRERVADYEAKNEQPPAEYVRWANAPDIEFKPLEYPMGATNHSILSDLRLIAQTADESRYELTKAWEACSYVIQWHIYAGGMKAEELPKFWRESQTMLRNHYLRQPARDYYESQIEDYLIYGMGDISIPIRRRKPK